MLHEVVSKLVCKKAFIPLENLYNIHPTSLSEETTHRGSQKAVDSWVGNKREPRAYKLHKKGQNKTWAAFRAACMCSPRQGNKTTAKITLAVGCCPADWRQTLEVRCCLITADMTFLLFKTTPATPAVPQPMTQLCLPSLPGDPVGMLHGFADLPAHQGGACVHTSSCKKGCPQSKTHPGWGRNLL